MPLGAAALRPPGRSRCEFGRGSTDDRPYRLVSDLFPRASRYNPDWLIASTSGGANSLWLAEWLSEVVDLKAGHARARPRVRPRRRSRSSWRREFGVQVWAADLWFSATENQQRIRDAGVDDRVTAVHADARALPFEAGFFDAIVCIDSFLYFATDDHYLAYLARFAKPDGVLALAGACMLQEIDGDGAGAPRARGGMPSVWSLHSPAWWRRHWEKTGFVDRRARRRHARRLEALARLAARGLRPRTPSRSRRSRPTPAATSATCAWSPAGGPT